MTPADFLQYGALGLVALFMMVTLPFIVRGFTKAIDRLGDRVESGFDRQTDSLAAQSRNMEERIGRSIDETRREVQAGRCRYGRSPAPGIPRPPMPSSSGGE